jgi:hypothetical protein
MMPRDFFADAAHLLIKSEWEWHCLCTVAADRLEQSR